MVHQPWPMPVLNHISTVLAIYMLSLLQMRAVGVVQPRGWL